MTKDGERVMELLKDAGNLMKSGEFDAHDIKYFAIFLGAMRGIVDKMKKVEKTCQCLDPIQVVRGGLCCNCDGKLSEKP